MKSWLRTLCVVSLISAAALALGACAAEGAHPVVDGLTVEQAKAQSQEWEMRVAELVTADDVEKVEQAEFGSLRSCDTEGAYRWTGNTFVYLKQPLSEAEADELTSTLADNLEQTVESEYVVTKSEATQRLAVEMFGPDGALYTAWTLPNAKSEGVAVVNVTSSSPCFVLPDDIHPGENV